MVKIESLSLVDMQSAYDYQTLQTILREMNRCIKQNADVFRLLFEFNTESISSKLYKNSIVSYYMSKGFKIVVYQTFIYIDWSKTDVYDVSIDSTATDMNYLGEYFKAQDIYLIVTGSLDLRKVSYRTLYYYIVNNIKDMIINVPFPISVGISCTLTQDQLNRMFAVDIRMLNKKFPNTEFTFLDNGIFQVTKSKPNVEYTDIPDYVLFGTHTTI